MKLHARIQLVELQSMKFHTTESQLVELQSMKFHTGRTAATVSKREISPIQTAETVQKENRDQY
jgi:hypothetical protein